MYGETWGNGPPAVLALHGWRRSHADFAAALGPGSPGDPPPTMAPDLPGFGATPEPPGPWGSPDYADAVAALLRSADGPDGPVVVVGHSLGGRIAVRLAAAHPDLVGALVLTGAPLVRVGGRRRPPVAYRLARAMHRVHLVGEGRMEKARRRHGSADYRAAEGVMRDVLVRLVNETYDDALGVLADRRCPVELVWGDDDAEAPPAVARALAEALPQARVTWCPGAGHLTPLTAPAELRAAVRRALACSSS